MERITLDEYFGPFWNLGEDTPEMRRNAERLLAAVNVALGLMVGDGIALAANPATGGYVSGEGNGGFRGHASKVGAASSLHRTAEAIDIYDPHRLIAAWCLRNHLRLIALGILGMERPEWTPTWCHLQSARVHSGTWCFVPSSEPPLVAALPEQLAAGFA